MEDRQDVFLEARDDLVLVESAVLSPLQLSPKTY